MSALIADATQRASTPDFLALVGYEWGGRFAQGHRRVLFAPGWLPKFTNGDSVARESCASITRLFRQLCRDGVDVLSIPHPRFPPPAWATPCAGGIPITNG